MAKRHANFGKWLADELTQRGWTNSEFCQRAGISNSMVSVLISNHDQVAGLDTCVGTAKALNYSLEYVLRKAGHLAYIPADKVVEGEFLHLFNQLDDRQKKLIMLCMRSWLEFGK